MTLAPTDLQRVGRLLLTRPYRFAKTMPENPHWYTLRKEWPEDGSFDLVVQAIRAGGYTEHYGGRPYRMLNVNGKKYWTMGAPVPKTILINRKDLGAEGPAVAYDAIAPTYDAAFNDPESEAENRAVMDMIGDISTLSVLDIGCGTGLLLDSCSPGAYTGIDPSAAMLDRLRAKHPRHADDVLRCRLEEYVGDGFDLAVCLFGSVSYIDPAYVAAIPSFLHSGGRYVVMFLADGYTPVTYARTGHSAPFRDGVFADLPGIRSTLGNFIIVDGRAP